MEEDPDTWLIDAKLSKGAYNQAPLIDGWQRDNTLSNENRSVYFNPETKKAKVAFTGTNFGKKRWIDDVGTDLLIGLGLQEKSNRFKNAKRTADLASQKYGKENVSLTGHSLGGSQSAYVSRATGLKASGFNAGWSPIDALRKRTFSNFKNITAHGDIISNSGRGVKQTQNIYVKPKSKNAHSLINFL